MAGAFYRKQVLIMLKKIAITMGDPSGVGAEVVIKALASRQILPKFIPVVIGDAGVLELNRDKLGYDLKFIEAEGDLSDLRPVANNECYLIKTSSRINMADFRFGVISAEYGRAAGSYIEKAAELVIKKKLDALVTAPISKKAFNLGGYSFQGHTDFLAHITGNPDEVMMLTGGELSVILCTVHVALKDVASLLTEELIMKVVTVAKNDFKKYFKKPNPKFAVAGLNPHASEDGTFGHEENEIIIPAIKKLRKQGIDITDPLPPDSLFYKAKDGIYDAVICMYHDQGVIPIKVLSFSTGINITLGIGIIRTSVDHGTAFEIAGKGEANELSMLNALGTAISMSSNEQQ
jgi:4-hydroxythreonine-4-phosphate dehydrogenase